MQVEPRPANHSLSGRLDLQEGRGEERNLVGSQVVILSSARSLCLTQQASCLPAWLPSYLGCLSAWLPGSPVLTGCPGSLATWLPVGLGSAAPWLPS